MPTPLSHARQVFAYSRPAVPRWPVACKAAVAMAVPLLVTGLAGDMTLGFVASLGVFTVLYAPTAPVRLRALVTACVAVALVACAALGSLTAGHPAAAVTALAVVGALAAFTCNALLVGPPGAYFFVLVVGVAGTMVAHGIGRGEIVAATAAGAAWGFVVGLSDLVVDPHAPERRSVGAAEAAVACYEQAPDDDARRAAASTTLHAAWTSVRDGGSRPGLVERVRRVENRFTATTARAAGHVLGLPPRPFGRVEGVDDTDDGATGDLGATDGPAAGARDEGASIRDTSLGRPRAAHLLRSAATWPGEKPLLVLRTVVGIVTAWVLGTVAGTEHAYWAAAAAALVLHQGGTRVAQTHRGIQRFVGTIVGLVVFALLHTVVHAPWQLACVVVVLQLVVELLVVRSYALAVVAITPLALTIATAGRPGPVSPIIADRGLDTAIGVVCALATLWATGWGTAVPILRAHARRVVEATRGVVADLRAGEVDSPAALDRRRTLYVELLGSDEIARRALVDERSAVLPYRRMERAVADLGYLVLGLCWMPGRPHGADVYARAAAPLDRIVATPVRRPRPADDIAADVEAAAAVLRAG